MDGNKKQERHAQDSTTGMAERPHQRRRHWKLGSSSSSPPHPRRAHQLPPRIHHHKKCAAARKLGCQEGTENWSINKILKIGTMNNMSKTGSKTENFTVKKIGKFPMNFIGMHIDNLPQEVASRLHN